MAGELKPFWEKETEEQIDRLVKGLNSISVEVKALSNLKVDFKTFKEYTNAVKEQEEATTKLTTEQKKLEAVEKRLAFAQSEAGKQYARTNALLTEQNKENRDVAKSTLNVGDAYDQLRRSLTQAEKEYRILASTQGLSSKETLEAQKAVQRLREEVDAINTPIKRFSDNVGNYPQQVTALVPGFDRLNGILENFGVNLGEISANNQGAKATFASIAGGLLNITNKALLFIATPIGQAIAAFTLISAATAKFFSFNAEIAKTNTLVEQLANTSGKATDQLREQATAITKTFANKDFNDAVRELSDLQKDFGIDSKEAFDAYTRGLALGGAASTDFGDSISEYGVLFSQAGFTADEFLNILNTGIDLGVYTDKLPDAIKEAGISLDEQTKATRDALVNAFGASFTEDILAKVKSGELTTKEALTEIAKAADKAGLNQQQYAQLTADVFRGAGEDAGGAKVVFDALNASINETGKELTALQKYQIEATKQFNELEKAQTKAFKSDAAVAFSNNIQTIFTDIQIWFFNKIATYREGIQNLILDFKGLGANFEIVFTAIPKLAKAAFNDFKNIIKDAASTAVQYGNVFKAALSFEFDNAQKLFNGIDKINTEFTETKKVLGEISAERQAANLAIIKEYEAQLVASKRLNDAQKEQTTDTTTNNSTDLLDKDKIEKDAFDVSKIIEQVASDNEAILKESQERIAKEYENGTITATEFIQQIADASKDSNVRIIEATIEQLNKVLEVEKLSAEERAEVQEELENFKYALLDESLAKLQEKADEEIAIEKERAALIKAIRQKERDERSEEEDKQEADLLEREKNKQRLIEGFTQLGFDTITEIGNNFFNAQSEQRQTEFTKFQEDQNKRFEYINELQQNGVLTEEEAQLARLRIEEETTRKANELRRKQAIADKNQALFNIALNTAQGITFALIRGDFVSAGLIGAAGAIQAIGVAARPIPEFYKGTENAPGGLAWVGERGTELIQLPTGEEMLATEKAIMDLPKGTKVKTADETKKILKDRELLNEMKGLRSDLKRKNLNVNLEVNNNSRIDYLRG